MRSQESLRRPQNVETLSEQELVRRLHDQLSTIFHRIFFTGDWAGQDSQNKDIRENIFEDVAITDPKILANAIDDFLEASRETLPKTVRPNELSESRGKHDANRLLFIETLKYVRDILKSYQKDIGTREHIEMAKGVDENIQYFRDLSIKNIKGERGAVMTGSIAGDDERAQEGLHRIHNRLSDIFESMGWRNLPDASRSA